MKQNIYYTYAYLRDDGTPYYIGKGHARRAYESYGRSVKPKKDKSNIVMLHENCSQPQALAFEIFWIAVYGRKDIGTGILHNRTPGGDGITEHTEENLSILRRPKSPETREKLRLANLGKKGTDESKAAQRRAKELNPTWNKGRTGIYNDETLSKMAESKNKLRKICPYCNKEFDFRNYRRWHGDNCKLKDGK